MKSIVFIMAFMLASLVQSEAQATSLHEFSKSSNGSTAHFGGVKVKAIREGNQTKRDGLSFYTGHVEMELEYHPEGKPPFTKTVNIWFDRRSEAMLFVAVMRNDPSLDLYYNFSNNPFNSTGYSTSCRILGSFICRDFPVTIVDFNNLDGNRLWIHNQDTNRMTEATEAGSAHEVAALEQNVFDGSRDEQRTQDRGREQQGQSEQAQQAGSINV